MSIPIVIALICASAAFTLLFASLTYALRDYSRVKLEERLERSGKLHWLQPTITRTGDLIFATAICRLIGNLCVLIGVLHLMRNFITAEWAQYTSAVLITLFLMLFFSVAFPHTISEHAGEPLIATFAPFLHRLRWLFLPVTNLMHAADAIVRKIARPSGPATQEAVEQEIENEILSVVEAGAKEGVVDEQERDMIQRVIHFHGTKVSQTMSARPEIVSLPVDAPLETVRATIEESGHSRIPVYEGNLDHIVGVLYARDLLKHLGENPAKVAKFDIHWTMRPAFFVPETKPLSDLLRDFRDRKVHMAIVLDEYGGTAGLVTIEDLLEELVGEISDEHEPLEPEMFKRVTDTAAEVDARMYIEQLNRLMSVDLREDQGYDTLGGFVGTTLGSIPQPGTTFDHEGARYTILEAEPTKVNRVRIDLLSVSNGSKS